MGILEDLIEEDRLSQERVAQAEKAISSLSLEEQRRVVVELAQRLRVSRPDLGEPRKPTVAIAHSSNADANRSPPIKVVFARTSRSRPTHRDLVTAVLRKAARPLSTADVIAGVAREDESRKGPSIASEIARMLRDEVLEVRGRGPRGALYTLKNDSAPLTEVEDDDGFEFDRFRIPSPEELNEIRCHPLLIGFYLHTNEIRCRKPGHRGLVPYNSLRPEHERTPTSLKDKMTKPP